MLTRSSRNTVNTRRRMMKKIMGYGAAAGRDWVFPARRRGLYLLSRLGPARLGFHAELGIVVTAHLRVGEGVGEGRRPVDQRLGVDERQDAGVLHDLLVHLGPDPRQGRASQLQGLGETVLDHRSVQFLSTYLSVTHDVFTV